MTTTARPPIADAETWRGALAELRVREKAATRELDAIAAQRRRLPMVKMPDYTLMSAEGPVRLVDVFGGKRQLITYHHMWQPGAQWQCPGCTGGTAGFTRPQLLEPYDARLVIVTPGEIGEALAYRERVGNELEWYSTHDSDFGADVDAPPGGGFAYNVFLRDGEDVYRTYSTTGRGAEQFMQVVHWADVLPYGRQEAWEDSPQGWPQHPTYSDGLTSQDIARLFGRSS